MSTSLICSCITCRVHRSFSNRVLPSFGREPRAMAMTYIICRVENTLTHNSENGDPFLVPNSCGVWKRCCSLYVCILGSFTEEKVKHFPTGTATMEISKEVPQELSGRPSILSTYPPQWCSVWEWSHRSKVWMLSHERMVLFERIQKCSFVG